MVAVTAGMDMYSWTKMVACQAAIAGKGFVSRPNNQAAQC
jgi:hypothetical protein